MATATMSPQRQDTRAANLPTLSVRSELARLVRAARLRLDPEEIPGFLRLVPRRRARTVSQEVVAVLLGVTAGWYAHMERGDDVVFSPDLIDRTAITLRMSPDERRLLYLFALGTEPPRPATTGTVLPAGLQTFVDSQQCPAIAVDDRWNVLGFNDAAQDVFPWLGTSESNTMRWALTFPEARTQLVDWDTVWAPHLAASLRLAFAQHPDDPAMNTLLQELLVDPDVRRIWNTAEPAAQAGQWELFVPYNTEPSRFEVVTGTPWRGTGTWVVSLVPVHDPA